MSRRAVLYLLLLAPVPSVFAQAPAPVIAPATYRVVYLEVAPADVTRVASALKDYRRASMNALGALRVDLLQHVDAQRAERVHRGSPVVLQRGGDTRDIRWRDFEVDDAIRRRRDNRRGSLGENRGNRRKQQEIQNGTTRHHTLRHFTSHFPLLTSNFAMRVYTGEALRGRRH